MEGIESDIMANRDGKIDLEKGPASGSYTGEMGKVPRPTNIHSRPFS